MSDGAKRKRFFTLEHGTTHNPKVLPLSDGAFRVFVCAIDYSASNLLDGWISSRSATVVAATAGARSINACAKELVAAGLWDDHATDGWTIHDYHDHQPTAEYMKRLSDAGKKAARARWGNEPDSDPQCDSHENRNAHVLALEPKRKTPKAVPVARPPARKKRPSDAAQVRTQINDSLGGAT